VQFGFLDELDELVALHAKFAKAGGRVDAEHGADLAVA
jgi:hypothetical protein